MTEQEKREKVIKGLECCIKRNPDDKTRCGECPYESACLNRLKSDALALLKAQEPIEARLNLCESCTKEYPECDATADGIEFGCGVGNDNVIGCTAYVNRWKAQEPCVMTLEEVHSCENAMWIELFGGKGFYAFVLDRMKNGILEISTRAAYLRYYSKDYNVKWRCWTSRPTDEQREAVKWK